MIAICGGILFLLLYYCIGRRIDRVLIAELDKGYPERWNKVSKIKEKNQNQHYMVDETKIAYF